MTTKKMLMFVLALACGSSSVLGQVKVLTQDPLTGLPVPPATLPRPEFGNAPTTMPPGTVCKSKMQGEFYSLYDLKTSAAVAWYAAHLTGFTKTESYGRGRMQVMFANADRTVLVVVTGNSGPSGQDVDADSVAYEKYTPGLAAATIAGFTKDPTPCQ
jgi:hypothetical protein